jgi:hypothetical protein
MANPKTEAQAALKKAETALTRATEKAQDAQQKFIEAEMARVIAEREYAWHKANPALLDPPTIGSQPQNSGAQLAPGARWEVTNIPEEQAKYVLPFAAQADQNVGQPAAQNGEERPAERPRRRRRTKAEIEAARAAEAQPDDDDGEPAVTTPAPTSFADFAPPAAPPQEPNGAPELPVQPEPQSVVTLFDAQGRPVALPAGFAPPF